MSANEGDSIKIFLRVRPSEHSSAERNFAHKVLDVNTVDKAIILRTKPEPKIFTYDNVGDVDITQEAVFSIVGKKIIESCVAGYNGTIFAYGQTGSGKTFTMLGPSENTGFHSELRGLIPRSFEYMYGIIAKEQKQSGTQKQFLCRCSFLEIYQEQIFDLLDPTSQGLHLRENMNKGVFVDGLIEKVICSPNDAFKVLTTGWLNRRVAATSMNRESSRSHAVFTVTIESKEDAHGVQTIRTSCLNLVDLAGSERQKDTNTAGVRLKEAGSINRSLHVLGTVIMSLVDLSHGKKRHIPYRDSKLTFLLKDSLGGNAKTHMVACVHPDSRCFGETLSTLNFARSAKLIKNMAVVNEDFRGSHLELQKEICRLKALLEAAENCGSMSSKPGLGTLSIEADLNADTAWKKCFIEAMYFREASEKEKQGLQGEIMHLQELCGKKDKFNQSTKMIIKFRENTIQNLQKQAQSRSEVMDSEDVTLLKEEIKVLRQQLDCNPQLAKYSGENKNLRQELEQVRSQCSLNDVLNNGNRIDELEQTFKQLMLSKEKMEDECNNAVNNLSRDSPSKDKLLAEATEKHKSEVKSYQKEIELLKKTLLDSEKKAESQQMEMDVELLSCRKMISELERALEAHQLKARTENNALKDLHCQTLKLMTPPVPSRRKDSILSMNQSVCTEDGQESIGDDSQNVTEGAQDALMEELQTLTAENSKLQKTIDEHASEMLRLKQELEKKGLHSSQLKSLLEKERAEISNQAAVETALKEELKNLNENLKLMKSENVDLNLVLKSADKELKEVKSSFKDCQQKAKLEKQTLETQLAQKSLELEKASNECDDMMKELSCLKEEMETTLTTKSFYENRAQELENSLSQEVRNRERLESQLESMKSAEDVAQKSLNTFMEDAKAQIRSKDEELSSLKTELGQKDETIMENKAIVSNLMENIQEMKTKLSESEVCCSALKMENVNSCQEMEEIQRDLDAKSTEILFLQSELKKSRDQHLLELQRRDFEIANLQEDQESNSDSILALKQALDDKDHEIAEKHLRIQDLHYSVEDLKTKTKLQEMELRDAEKESEKVKSFETVLQQRDEELMVLSSANEAASASLLQIQAENKSLRELLDVIQAQSKEGEVDRMKCELRVLNEEKEKLMDELHREREGVAKLVGHNNPQQKIRLLDKKTQELRELQQRYQDLWMEHSKCGLKAKASSYNLANHKLEDITNTNSGMKEN